MAEKRKFSKKFCKYSAMKIESIDYKNSTDQIVETMLDFIEENNFRHYQYLYTI